MNSKVQKFRIKDMSQCIANNTFISVQTGTNNTITVPAEVLQHSKYGGCV